MIAPWPAIRKPKLTNPGQNRLFEAEQDSRREAQVFLRCVKDFCAVVIELCEAHGKLIIQFPIRSATQDPTRGCVGRAIIDAEVRDADESVTEDPEAVAASGYLRAKEYVELAPVASANRFVIGAEISFESEPIVEISGERGFKTTGLGKRVAVEQRVAKVNIAARALLMSCSLGKSSGGKRQDSKRKDQLAHSEKFLQKIVGQNDDDYHGAPKARGLADDVACGYSMLRKKTCLHARRQQAQQLPRWYGQMEGYRFR